MNRHPYLRAYLAGIACPTVFLLVVMTAYTIIRYVYNVPIPVERVIMFPMAVVPNLWGLWNVLYTLALRKRNVPLGAFGALLPLLLAPMGYLIARALQISIPPAKLHDLPFGVVIGLVIYYLAWKYLVGFLNAELGVA